jgi:hypothetical protein
LLDKNLQVNFHKPQLKMLMADAIKQFFGRDTDHKQAYMVAQKIAELLGSRVTANEQIIIGQPYFPFKASLHTKEFQCFLFISDVSYCFTTKRRPKTPFAADFRISLKEPDRVGGARILVNKQSKAIGVNVFSLPRCPDDALDTAFSTGLLGILRKIQFNRVLQFHFSPVQLDVVASLDSPEFCVNQALIFRDLVVLANQEAYERNKSLLG